MRGTSDVVAEYTYNGLGYRIGWHYDVDADGTVEANTEQNSDDPWFHFVYDTRWRIVAVYRVLHWHAEGGWTFDADPKERFVYHNAGLAGGGGSSYIDAVILRDRDANTAWEDQADGTLEERIYYCQNWRADVVALFSSAGQMLHQVRYDPYGVLDSNDSSLFVTLYNSGSGTHPFADWNLDGSLSSLDLIAFGNSYNADAALGYGVLSYDFARPGGANRKGYAGYELAPELSSAKPCLYHVRHRVYDASMGRWIHRDPLGYIDGMSLYGYVRSRPIGRIDPYGLASSNTGGGGGCSTSNCNSQHSFDDREIAFSYDEDDWNDKSIVEKQCREAANRALEHAINEGWVDPWHRRDLPWHKCNSRDAFRQRYIECCKERPPVVIPFEWRCYNSAKAAALRCQGGKAPQDSIFWDAPIKDLIALAKWLTSIYGCSENPAIDGSGFTKAKCIELARCEGYHGGRIAVQAAGMACCELSDPLKRMHCIYNANRLPQAPWRGPWLEPGDDWPFPNLPSPGDIGLPGR